MKSFLLNAYQLNTLNVSSPVFNHRNYIPKKYTYDGDDINPPFIIKNIPKGTKSMALILDDPNSLVKSWVWNHWLVWNIKIDNVINENSVPGTVGINDFKIKSYRGPCPLSGTHFYHFKFYALDSIIDLNVNSTKQILENKISNHLLAFSEIVGLYKYDRQSRDLAFQQKSKLYCD